MRVILPRQLTPQHEAVVLRYLTDRRSLCSEDWQLVFEAFDLLADAVVETQRGRQTFAEIYRDLVETPYADLFIEQLVELPEPLGDRANRLKASVAHTVNRMLIRRRLFRADVPESNYLLAYCYYWWDSFARGYIFEEQIFRDLRRTGIRFTAHDIRRRAERFSPYDLIVQGRQGDIKTSTYFIWARRTRRLLHDFYITRLYDYDRLCRLLVVLLTEDAWNDLNGDAIDSDLGQAAQVFPEVARVTVMGCAWIVIEYEEWKRRVKARQTAEVGKER